MRALDWKAFEKNTLRGFFTLQLQSGLVLHGLTLHRDPGGKEWIGLPGAPQIEDGRHRADPATGKPAYTRIVEIPDKATRARFQTLALAAVHALLGDGVQHDDLDGHGAKPPSRTRAPRRPYAHQRPPAATGEGDSATPTLPDDPVADLWRGEGGR